MEAEADAIHFLNQAFKHCKAIAADAQDIRVLEATYFIKKLPADFTEENVLAESVIVSDDAAQLAEKFVLAMEQHRFSEREKPGKIPA